MVDDRERTIPDEGSQAEESPAERSEAAGSGGEADRTGDSEHSAEEWAVDRAAESFLDIEAGLAEEGETTSGIAVGAARLDATDVPSEYPRDIATDEVLALDVELLDDRVVTVFVDWDLDGPLGRLLDRHDLDPSRFGDLHGRRIPLRRQNQFYVFADTDTPDRGDPRAIYGLATTFGLTLLGWVVLAVGLGSVGSSLPVVLAWLAISVLGLPATTYLDAWHLRSNTDWNQGPLFWTLLAALPGVNVASTLLYLYTRSRAE